MPLSIPRTRQLILPVVVFLLLAATPGSGATKLHEEAPLLQAEGVRFIGQFTPDHKIGFFLGIPFAEAPVDALRWQPPQPVIPRQQEVRADSFADACMQGGYISDWYRKIVVAFGGDPETFPAPRESEDCLYLNIWSPVNSASTSLPVLVYIHGGANKGGWSYEPNYIGEQLARKGVVVVSISYRLGVFGFFAHPQLEHTNFGLLDQVAALNWVRENIDAVGGDPDRITLMGESAGANNIDYLLTSPLAQGLFKRIIHQSGGSALRHRVTRADYLQRGQLLSEELVGKDEWLDIERLRQVEAQPLLERSRIYFKDLKFDPVVDGHSVIAHPLGIIEAQDFPPIDLLIGTNRNERRSYIPAGLTVDAWLAAKTSPEQAAQLKSLLDSSASRLEQLDKLDTAYMYACNSLWLAAQAVDRGGLVWFYEFFRQRNGEMASTMGVYHGAELPYVFDTHDTWLPTADKDREVTQWMIGYWANFIKYGDPNGKGLPPWPLFQHRKPTIQRIGDSVQSRAHTTQSVCDVLKPYHRE